MISKNKCTCDRLALVSSGLGPGACGVDIVMGGVKRMSRSTIYGWECLNVIS
jgi:hypothetical protein